MISAHQAASNSFRAFVQQVRSLNLRSLVYQLQHSPVSHHWTVEQTRKIITHYFAFLYLVDRYSNLVLVPTPDIDHVWHCHILDTEQYAADCQTLFGDFIHHAPLSSMDFDTPTESEAKTNQQSCPNNHPHNRFHNRPNHRREPLTASVLTQVLFRKHFGCSMLGCPMGKFSSIPADYESLAAWCKPVSVQPSISFP